MALGIHYLAEGMNGKFAAFNSALDTISRSITENTDTVLTLTGETYIPLRKFARNFSFDLMGTIVTSETVIIPRGMVRHFWIRNSTLGTSLVYCHLAGSTIDTIQLIPGVWYHLLSDGTDLSVMDTVNLHWIHGYAIPANGTAYSNSEVVFDIPMPACTIKKDLVGARFSLSTANGSDDGNWVLGLYRGVIPMGSVMFYPLSKTPDVISFTTDRDFAAGNQISMRVPGDVETGPENAFGLGFSIPLVLG